MQRQLELYGDIVEPDLGVILDVDVPVAKPTPARHDTPQPRDPGADERQHRPSDGARRARKPAKSLYVANLPWSATEQDLEQIFSRYGRVHAATIIVDKRSGRSKGFGFVDMAQPAAKSAIKGLHGTKLGGRDLTVRLAQPRRYGG